MTDYKNDFDIKEKCEETLSGFNRFFIVLTVIMVALTLFTYVFLETHYLRGVTGYSMQPTLNREAKNDYDVYDKVYVSKTQKGTRGDIIVTKNPRNPDGDDVIKRIIALPGDKLKLTWDAATKICTTWLNGQVLEEKYANKNSDAVRVEIDYNYFVSQSGWLEMPCMPDAQGYITIPEGFFFYMGDNRGGSSDCRYYGPQPLTNILGRVDLVVGEHENFFINLIASFINPITEAIGIVFTPLLELGLKYVGNSVTPFLKLIGMDWLTKTMPSFAPD